MSLTIPPQIEHVIKQFDERTDAFTELDIQQHLGKARGSLQEASDPEKFGAWAEVLAFALVGARNGGSSPWGTYFGPMGSGTTKDGKTVYFPDVSEANAEIIDHWAARSGQTNHPILKARYSDLVWEMSPLVAKRRRDPDMARLAIDSYLASISQRSEMHDKFHGTLRALDLACMIHDNDRIDQARLKLLDLHRESMQVRRGLWWLAFDRLIQDKHARVTDEERAALVADLETLFSAFANTSAADEFDPHAAQDAARRLIAHYGRSRQPDEVKRLHKAVGQAFEHFASLGDAMLASAVLQTAVNSYRDAGLPEESKRVRVLMEERIGQARDLMKPVETEISISKDDMESFLKVVVVSDLGSTFVRLAAEFLPHRDQLERQVQKTLEEAPLLAHIPQTIMADNHVAAKVGSVEDDPFGRLIHQCTMSFGFSAIWLREAFDRAITEHNIVPGHVVGWANRLDLFEDLTFLIEGVEAWYQGDFVKAVHLLVPQVEHGLRSITGKLGQPVTKAHSTVAGVSVAIGMGDILYKRELSEALGPDLSLYFLALYADPRGINLRNDFAHGLLRPRSVDGNLARWVIHTLLVFGVWDEIAKKRR
jgi:lysyl-tRNA synthetase class 1